MQGGAGGIGARKGGFGEVPEATTRTVLEEAATLEVLDMMVHLGEGVLTSLLQLKILLLACTLNVKMV